MYGSKIPLTTENTSKMKLKSPFFTAYSVVKSLPEMKGICQPVKEQQRPLNDLINTLQQRLATGGLWVKSRKDINYSLVAKFGEKRGMHEVKTELAKSLVMKVMAH